MDYNELVKHCRTIGPLGGRPKGKKNKATLLREKVAEEYRQLILADARRLFFSQSVLAHGQQFLYRIDKIQTGKNRYMNSEPKLVTKQVEIEAYLLGLVNAANGDMNNENDQSASYFFITTREPNQQTIADMLDRATGRARQVVGIEGPTPGSSISIAVEDKQYERAITDEFNRLGTGIGAAIAAGTESTDTPSGGEAQPH